MSEATHISLMAIYNYKIRLLCKKKKVLYANITSMKIVSTKTYKCNLMVIITIENL